MYLLLVGWRRDEAALGVVGEVYRGILPRDNRLDELRLTLLHLVDRDLLVVRPILDRGGDVEGLA